MSAIRDTGINREKVWEERFAQLVAYRERFGHCRVPAKWEENIPFGHWVHVQREFKKKGMLSEERIARLDSIGFEWHSSRSRAWLHADVWSDTFAHLVAWQEEHGHANVPASHRENALGKWVQRQRHAYHTGTLAPARREKLESIGFEWRTVNPSHEKQWEIRFAQMLAYRERFGHCRVPAKWNENRQLGRWVGAQKEFRKKCMLNEERIRRLDEIGFTWQAGVSRNKA